MDAALQVAGAIVAVVVVLFAVRWLILMAIRNERENACFLMHEQGLQCGCAGCWCVEGVRRIRRS